MKEILFLVHRIPYPPNKGDKLRSFNLLKQLLRNYRVHLGTFIDDEDDWRHTADVQAMVGESYFARLAPRRAKLRSLPALLNNTPLSLPYYRDSGLQAWVNRILKERPIRQVIIFSGAMAQYLDGPTYTGLRRIVDFVDIDSDKWRQYAKSQLWPMSWIYRREAATLLNYERRVAVSMNASVFVSDHEAELFKQLAPEAASRIWGIHNGVDLEYFMPSRDYPNPYEASELPIVFTGAMDYWANVDAVTWFVKEIFPKVRERARSARFYIVGARPGTAVLQLRQESGVSVTGAVHDIRPYLAHARVAVAPLRIARGVQNKVLEAMAMARPVVVTPQALDGIICQADREVIMADGAEAFIDKVYHALQEDTGGIAVAARQRIESDYDWETNLHKFEVLLEGSAVNGMNSLQPENTHIHSDVNPISSEGRR